MPKKVVTNGDAHRRDAAEVERLTARHADFVRDRLAAGDDLMSAHRAAQHIQDQITSIYMKRGSADD